MIVGEAFKASSNSVNYYRDLALVFPFFFFSLASAFQFSRPWNAHYVLGVKFAALALASILLAKEKKFMFLGGLGLLSLGLLRVTVRTLNWKTLLGLLIVLSLIAFFGHRWRNYKLSYEILPGIRLIDLAVTGTSLLITFLGLHWLIQ